jgi:cysteine synthase A
MSPVTPLLPLALPLADGALYAKIEYLHPSGSIKHRSIPPFLDRIAASGELAPGAQIAIRSAGAAAVATAWAGARAGHPVLAVLPPTAAPNIVRLVRWLGADCQQVPSREATKIMDQLRADPGTYVLEQAAEPRMIDSYRPVAAEILDQLPAVTAITVGIGTGLSATGIAKEISARRATCQVYGVEPAESAIASGKPWAPHGIPGLAPPIAQPLLGRDLLAGILTVESGQAWRHAEMAARLGGLLIGPSAGAAVAAALQLLAQGQAGPVVAICACSIGDYLEASHDTESRPHAPGATATAT